VLGRSIGVLHRTDPVHEPADEVVVATLESLASKSGTRLSIVRAATNTAPAAFDPSTGLLDRASTERHVFDLGRDLTPFSLAQGDIDHFQEYLRVNGREAANLAIRLVARVMQEILRPSDVIGRFGEDEFLVILPQASDGQAQRALERVREHLALTLATSSIPWFTVSFGVVESSFAQTLDDLLVAADVAVSMAKDLGRNRVVVANEELIDPRVEDDL
jgi:diguanylate cyclase (GGDEF)-like protein